MIWTLHIDKDDFQEIELFLFSLKFPKETEVDLYLLNRHGLIVEEYHYFTKEINGEHLLATN